MGFGLIGALAGAGEGVAGTANTMFKETMDEAKQKALQEAMFSRQEALQDKNMKFTAEQNALGRQHAETMQERGFGHAEAMQESQQAFQAQQQENQFQFNEVENDLNRQLQKSIAGMHLKASEPQRQLAMQQLSDLQKISGMRTTLAAAVAQGDKSATESLKKSIEALGYTGDKTDTTQLMNMGTMAMKLAGDMNTSEDDRKYYGQVAKIALTAAMGNKDVSAPPYADGTELKGKDGNLYVVKGGVPVLKNASTWKAASGGGLIEQPPVRSGFDVNDPATWRGITPDLKTGAELRVR